MGDVSGSESNSKAKTIKHYSNRHQILLVGEGDFSFALSLANAFGSASNIVATSFDCHDGVKAMYSKGESNLKKLQEMGCTIIHKVDSRTMANHPLLCYNTFDRIVFNFPHAPLVWKEHDPKQIELHQGLVWEFMSNAREMLSRGGQVHVTHKTSYPFSKWNVKKLGKQVGMRLRDEVEFYVWEYPGYENKRGQGWRCDESFPNGDCTTSKFVLPYYY